MLISPTEPAVLRALGTVSSIPETLGADYLFTSPTFGVVGVQRKELGDLVASVYDGRLAKEIAQLRQCGLGVLVVEGVPTWTMDGELLISGSLFNRAQYHGVLWSAQLDGLWVNQTDGMMRTKDWLSLFEKWIAKERHSGVRGRPGPRSVWGKADSREWGVHLLQGFPGIGEQTAASIYDHFKGVPLMWRCDETEMRLVKGVGKGRARMLMETLNDG